MGIYQHLLTTGTEDTQQQDLSREFCACFTTITTTSDMSTPETYEGCTCQSTVPKQLWEDVPRHGYYLSCLYCSSIEAHPGKRRKASKPTPEGEKEEDTPIETEPQSNLKGKVWKKPPTKQQFLKYQE